MANSDTNKSIILFDGVCILCSSLVKFVINRDIKGKFVFATLQSDIGQNLLKKFNLSTDDYKSLIVIQGEQFYTKSSASIKIFNGIGGLWSILYLLIVIPKPIRDFLYSLIANNRYSIFGKNEECFIPTVDIKDRFLD